MAFHFLSAIALTLAAAIAIPSFAADTQIPVAAFVKRDKFKQPRLSPDGKHLAMIVTQELEGRDWTLLNIYALEGFKLVSPIRFALFQMPFDVRWVSNTRLIVPKAEDWGFLERPVSRGEIFATDFDGQNQEYLYGFDAFAFQRRGATMATDRNFGYGFVHSIPDQPNGRFFMGEQKFNLQSRRSFLYDVDAKTAVRKLVADVNVRDLHYLLQHDGTPRFAFGSNDNNRQIAFQRDADKDNWQAIAESKLGSDFRPLAFTPDDKDFFLLYAEKGGPAAFMRQSMGTGERAMIGSHATGNIDMIQYGPGTRQPFAIATEVGIPTVKYVDENSAEAQLHKQISKQFPGAYVDFATYSTDGNILLFTVSSDREPGEYYLFDRRTKKAEFLVAAQPLIDASRMAERRPIEFKSRDGLEIHGYLTLPPKREEKKLPLILLPHGGPQGVHDEWFFDPDAQFLASRGYAVLQVNYRGSGGRGDAFYRAGDKQWAKGMINDMIDGVRWTIAQGTTDPARICVYGGSYGAYAAMMTTIAEPDLFKCAVGYAGLYDLPMLLKGDTAKRSQRAFNFWAEVVGTDPELLKNDSLTYLADKIKVPILLVHGEQDLTTPKAQAEAMRDALTKAGKPFEWMMVPKEEHGFYAEKNRIAFYEKLEEFFTRNIGK